MSVNEGCLLTFVNIKHLKILEMPQSNPREREREREREKERKKKRRKRKKEKEKEKKEKKEKKKTLRREIVERKGNSV